MTASIEQFVELRSLVFLLNRKLPLSNCGRWTRSHHRVPVTAWRWAVGNERVKIDSCDETSPPRQKMCLFEWASRHGGSCHFYLFSFFLFFFSRMLKGHVSDGQLSSPHVHFLVCVCVICDVKPKRFEWCDGHLVVSFVLTLKKKMIFLMHFHKSLHRVRFSLQKKKQKNCQLKYFLFGAAGRWQLRVRGGQMWLLCVLTCWRLDVSLISKAVREIGARASHSRLKKGRGE